MPELICPTHDTLAYLEAIEGRLAHIQVMAAGTGAWSGVKRLRNDLRAEIAAGWAELERSCEEMMAAELREKAGDYFHEEEPAVAD
jgi:hypothetical protein